MVQLLTDTIEEQSLLLEPILKLIDQRVLTVQFIQAQNITDLNIDLTESHIRSCVIVIDEYACIGDGAVDEVLLEIS